jgi:serine O-acetyltransferase
MTVGHEQIGCRGDYLRFLEMDLRAHNVDRWAPWLAIKHPELQYQRMLRLVEYASTMEGPFGKALWAVARVRLARYSLRTGISIPPGVFGPGLSIAHIGSIVVNDQARVGSWCRIHSATNIGTFAGGAPTIGDFAYFAPGAVAFGKITIGDRVTIAANSTARSDAPDDTTIVGVRVRNISSTSRVMPGWIEYERTLQEK